MWTAEESSTCWLDGFDGAWLPGQVSRAVRLVRDGARCGLEVSGVVGTVPLANGDLLRVRPKVGDYNFVRMLLRADGLFQDLKPEFYELAAYAANDASVSPIALACRALCRALAEISRQSLNFQRTPRTARGAFAAGRVMPLQTAERMACRMNDPVVYAVRNRDYNTPEHRVLGKAADVALKLLQLQEDSHDATCATEWSRRFGSHFRLDDLQEVSKNLMAQRYGGSRGYYARALGLARIVLGDAGYSQDSASSMLGGEGFLIDAAQLFERYIRTVLVDKYKGTGLIVTKGGGIRNESLYLDGSYELEPDYVFQDTSTVRLIADAKYKRPDSGDHYQIVCYLMRYGVRTGILFFPEYERTDRAPSRRATRDGYTVFEVPLPLSDLDAVEEILSTSLGRFGTH
jgi:5-methylcytosine-specific restriction endonuclease McrBC regulatory subunit McrC